MRSPFKNFRSRSKSESAEDRLSDFSAQVLEHLQSLYNYAVGLSKNPTAAEDLVQETLLRAVRNAPKWRPHSNLKAWLFAIQRNLWINEYHRLQRVADVSSLSSLDENVCRNRSDGGKRWADEELSDEEIRREVRAAVDALSPPYREAIVLKDFEGFNYKEIAEIVEVPIGTVMSRLNRARTELRKRLQHLRQKKVESASYGRV